MCEIYFQDKNVMFSKEESKSGKPYCVCRLSDFSPRYFAIKKEAQKYLKDLQLRYSIQLNSMQY